MTGIDMGPDSGLTFAKPEPRRKTKARADRQERTATTTVRDYVFARERNLCRCCRLRPAASMHEIKSRGAGGKRTRKNSIAVCGVLVHEEPSCHTFLQEYQIVVGASVLGAEAELLFTAQSSAAADWLHIKVGEQILSRPMAAVEADA